jgi:O-antigen/teichoic acid export membrane protein
VLGGFFLVQLGSGASSDEIVIVSIVTVMGALQAMTSLTTSLLFARDAMHLSVAAQAANYLVTMTTGVAAIWLDRSFGTILFLSMLASAIQLTLTFVFVRRRLAGVPSEPGLMPRPELKRTMRRALPFAAVALVSVLHSNMLIILLGTSRYSDVALGRFAAAQRLASVILIVPSMVAQVLVPALSRAFAGDAERFAGMFERAYRYVLFVSLPAAATLAVVAPPLLTLAFGDEYAPAGDTLRILSLVLAGAPTYVLGPALIAMDRQGLLARVHTANLVVVGLAAFLLIPRFGAEGAAWAMVLGAVGSLVVYSRILFTTLSLRFPRGWAAKTVAASAVTTAACAGAADRVHFAVVALLVAPAVYVVANLALRTLGAADWDYVRSVILPARSAGR